jgi:hypothetical protein
MTSTTTADRVTTTVVDRFLEGIRTGRLPTDLYAPDAVLDATVPGWRFRAEGSTAILAEYQGWYFAPSELVSVERHPIEGGEVLRYLQQGERKGVTFLVHHMHLLKVAGDRIAADTVFCGGQWGPEAVAQMGAAAHAG